MSVSANGKFVVLSAKENSMSDKNLDLGEAKAVVASWIEGLSVSDLALPEPVRRELLDQLADATPLIDSAGNVWFEIAALASLGFGIFRHSFHVRDAVIYAAPYAPAGLTLHPSASDAARAATPPVQAGRLGGGVGVPFRKLDSSRSGPL